jgi:hypothetical protein
MCECPIPTPPAEYTKNLREALAVANTEFALYDQARNGYGRPQQAELHED